MSLSEVSVLICGNFRRKEAIVRTTLTVETLLSERTLNPLVAVRRILD